MMTQIVSEVTEPRVRGYNQTVVHGYKMCLGLYAQCGFNGVFIAATVQQCSVIKLL